MVEGAGGGGEEGDWDPFSDGVWWWEGKTLSLPGRPGRPADSSLGTESPLPSASESLVALKSGFELCIKSKNV